MKILVVGWFSFEQMGAKAGDLQCATPYVQEASAIAEAYFDTGKVLTLLIDEAIDS